MENLAIGWLGTRAAAALGVLGLAAGLLLLAAWQDLQTRRIPNYIVFPGAFVALLAHVLLPQGDGFVSALPGGLGLWRPLEGLAFGLLALLPFHLLRVMGAGDVKLMAMVGTFLGPQEVWGALFCTLIAGGALAVAVAWYRGILMRTLQYVRFMMFEMTIRAAGAQLSLDPSVGTSGVTLPYGVAIASGTLAYVTYRSYATGLL